MVQLMKRWIIGNPAFVQNVEIVSVFGVLIVDMRVRFLSQANDYKCLQNQKLNTCKYLPDQA